MNKTKFSAFLAYNNVEKELILKVENHIKHTNINIWHIGKMQPGVLHTDTKWNKLRESDIIIVLMTADFLANEEKLINEIINLNKQDDVFVFPIILSYCSWEISLFKDFVVFPKNRKSVLDVNYDTDQQLYSINKEIQNLICKLNENSMYNPNTEGSKGNLNNFEREYNISIQGNNINMQNAIIGNNGQVITYRT